ncbi:MAG: hypothetical protein KDG50_15115 [Chromatiales bacterium]|nr:hypothetical protein [Chromatiales bacterium]
MKAKRAKIEEMLEMQRKFMEIEHEQGVTLKDLYHEPEGFLGEYMEKYQSLATDVVDSAHEVKGSIRT